MYDIKALIWLFPILFMFHDFEEIILMKSWIQKNKNYLSKRFPKIAKRFLPHFNKITTSSFALGVAEEFALISIITIISFIANWYLLWIGLFIAFTIHLIIHFIQALLVRKYVPAVVTSILCLPFCMYIITKTVSLFSISSVIFYSIIGFVIMIVNLGLVHKGMDVFDKWLVRYVQEK